MVFKVDFVEDLGGPKEPAAADPKLAFYLGETLQRNAASIGKMAETVADGIIAVDTQQQTRDLENKMVAIREDFERGAMPVDEQKRQEAINLDWDLKNKIEADELIPKEEKDSLLKGLEDRMSRIEQGVAQRRISAREATYRYHAALKEAIAARPSIADDLRRVSGKWTGATDWDHFYMKQAMQEEEAQRLAQIKAQEERDKEVEKHKEAFVKDAMSKGDLPYDAAVAIANDPQARAAFTNQMMVGYQVKLAELEVNKAKAQGTLDTQQLVKTTNTKIAEASVSLMTKASLMLKGSPTSPISKYVSGGNVNWSDLYKDQAALAEVNAFIEKDFGDTLATLKNYIVQTAAGTAADVKASLDAVDSWAKTYRENLTAGNTSALNFLRLYSESRTKNLAEIAQMHALVTNVAKNSGTSAELLMQYNAMPRETFLATYGQGAVDATERLIAANRTASTAINDYNLRYGVTLDSLASGVAPDINSQGAADARTLATKDVLQGLSKGTINWADPKARNTTLTALKAFPIPPGTTDWNGKDGLAAIVTSGKLGQELKNVPKNEAAAVIDNVYDSTIKHLADFENSGGRRIWNREVVNHPWVEKGWVEVVRQTKETDPTMFQGFMPDEYGITVPSYVVRITEKGKQEAGALTSESKAGARGRTQIITDDKLKSMQYTINRSMRTAFDSAYTSAVPVLKTLDLERVNLGVEDTKPAPTSAPKDEGVTDKNWFLKD